MEGGLEYATQLQEDSGEASPEEGRKKRTARLLGVV